MEHCGSAAECGFTDRILTGGAEHVFLKRGDHCGRDTVSGPGGAADLEQLKPNVVLETLKSWIPGLTKLGYRLLVAALIVCIGFQIAKMLRKMLERSLIRMDMEVSIRKFLQSAVYVTICGLTIRIHCGHSWFCRSGFEFVAAGHAGKLCRRYCAASDPTI
mgnify:CR=1 FL=1